MRKEITLKDLKRFTKANKIKDVDPVDAGGESPLHEVAKWGKASVAVASELIRRGAVVDRKDNVFSMTPLRHAASNGNLELAEALLERGADPSSACKAGDTPLHSAVRRCDLDMIALLVSYGADPYRRNGNNKTPFDLAYDDSIEDCLSGKL